MNKLLVIIGVLAFSASASADAEIIDSIEGFYSNNKGSQTQGQFVSGWEGQGMDCTVDGGAVFCMGNGFGVVGSFGPRLDMVGVLTPTGCGTFRSAALRRYNKPTSTEAGLLIWRRGNIQRAFAGKGVAFDGVCLFTIRKPD